MVTASVIRPSGAAARPSGAVLCADTCDATPSAAIMAKADTERRIFIASSGHGGTGRRAADSRIGRGGSIHPVTLLPGSHRDLSSRSLSLRKPETSGAGVS